MLSRNQVKNWHFVHKWTSLISTLFLLMLCVTGLPLIFYHEIDQAMGNVVEAPEMAAQTAQLGVDRIVDKARALRPDDAVQFVAKDEDDPHVWTVGMGETAEAILLTAFYGFDARNGNLLYDYPVNQGFMNFMFRLHYDMFTGLKGTLFLGAMGLLLVVSLISGTVLYAPFMRKLKFGAVRKHKTRRIQWLDLHNLLGIATLAWVAMVGVTGVINTLAIPIYGYWQNTEVAQMIAPYQNQAPIQESGSVEQALVAARTKLPDMSLSFIAFPGDDFATPHHYVAYMHGDTPLTSKLVQPVLIDARTSVVTDTRELPWYVTALLVSQPLHFGDYGGLPLKILWALLDICAIMVLASGVYLWLKKRNVPFETRLRKMRGHPDDDSDSAAKPRGHSA